MRAFRGIRARLLAVALVLLAVPLLALQFIASMETFLRHTQEEHIADAARAAAAALSDRTTLFPAHPDRADAAAEERRRIVALFAAADTDAAASLGNAYAPSEEIERLLDILRSRSSPSRLWVVDARSRVRGLAGSLKELAPATASWMRPFASLVSPAPPVKPGDETQPMRSQVNRALIGVSSTEWRGTRDRDVAILSAAQPIFVGDDIVAAVVVEETTGAIQILKQSALKELLLVTLAVMAAALAVLLAFATRLATRIRRLHAEADAAIDAQGRVRGDITPTRAGDEIGDLTRSMSAVLARLREYNAYLEAMAGRLSHELRTPVAVVRSSLDNLRTADLPADARVYVDRANEGVGRLSRLIARLSEATRLEHVLESADPERFDLAQVVGGCVEGYRSAYAPRRFEFTRPPQPLWMVGVPDAFAQLLDKLVENAHDFAPAPTAITVSLVASQGRADLSVSNQGPTIPEESRSRLFTSMTSLREARDTQAAHLGLGLYIVRLVAEHHGGRVRVDNLPTGVRFLVSVPLAR